jgi:hypothetical protein
MDRREGRALSGGGGTLVTLAIIAILLLVLAGLVMLFVLNIHI